MGPIHGSCAHCRLSSRLNLQLIHEYMAPWVWRATHTCEVWGGKNDFTRYARLCSRWGMVMPLC